VLELPLLYYDYATTKLNGILGVESTERKGALNINNCRVNAMMQVLGTRAAACDLLEFHHQS